MKNKTNVFLGLILLFGTFIRFWGIDWGLPHEYQSEEYKVVKYALRMGSGDLNPHFFEYPSLYLYFMLFLYGLFFVLGKITGFFASAHDFALYFVKDPTVFYLLGRVTEAVSGVFIIYLVYRLGKKMFNEHVGLISALVMCGLPHFIYMSHIIKGYMGMTVLLLLFFFATLNIASSGEKKWYILSGILLGLSVSTRYHAAPFGISLLFAHFYRNYLLPNRSGNKTNLWNQNKFLLLALVLIPVFFFIGTPYALITPNEFWKDVGDNLDIYSTITGEETFLSHRIFTTLKNFLYLGDVPAPILLGWTLLSGLFYSIYRWNIRHLFIIIPVGTYLLIVGSYHHSAGGYLLQIFPLFIILGVYGLYSIEEKILKRVSLAILALAIAWNLLDGTKMAYSFTLEDTRTTANKWIEENIPPGSSILIDSKVMSPPILMSYEQLERYQKKAVQLNHYKKEYLTLQLEVHPGKGNGFHIYTVERSFRQIGSLMHQVQEVQKMEDLIKVSGDIKALKKHGIQYVVVNDFSKDGALKVPLPGITDYYKNLPNQSTRIKIFPPKSKYYHSDTIRIYKL